MHSSTISNITGSCHIRE